MNRHWLSQLTALNQPVYISFLIGNTLILFLFGIVYIPVHIPENMYGSGMHLQKLSHVEQTEEVHHAFARCILGMKGSAWILDAF